MLFVYSCICVIVSCARILADMISDYVNEE